ncbi:MAG TPA: T9SS type A sorting domain-containing protein [bacterium]|nr:T9SS type A sorting domain-containing protein [bacterium]
MRRYAIPLLLFLLICFQRTTHAQEKFLFVRQAGADEVHIAIDPQVHIDYGFSYPLTFALELSAFEEGARAWYRYRQGGAWLQLPEKSGGDFFNGIAAVRFERGSSTAYLSLGFSAESDSIFLRITNAGRKSIPARFNRICTYYDDREMAVTASADDMAGWSRAKFVRTLHITRSYRLWVSCGINSGGADAAVYRYIQAQLDSGYVEAACHSRSHPSLPYKDYPGEITGNKEDIIRNLTLPAAFTSGEREYVYTWIAPNGRTNAIIDSLLTLNKFLFNRLYVSNFFGLSPWNEKIHMFTNAGVTRAFDPPASQLGWGIGTNDLGSLNGAFDKAMSEGSVYHVMCHPNVVEWEKGYPVQHLAYICNRPNVWYVAVGHLYLYHLAQSSYQVDSAAFAGAEEQPEDFILQQNYPNPFNPETTIAYRLAGTGRVRLELYNSRGEMVERLVDGLQNPGHYRVVWNAGGRAAGVYFCRLISGAGTETRKMLLVR